MSSPFFGSVFLCCFLFDLLFLLKSILSTHCHLFPYLQFSYNFQITNNAIKSTFGAGCGGAHFKFQQQVNLWSWGPTSKSKNHYPNADICCFLMTSLSISLRRKTYLQGLVFSRDMPQPHWIKIKVGHVCRQYLVTSVWLFKPHPPKTWESHEFFLPDSITVLVLFEGTFIQSMRQGSERDELHHLMT